MKLDPVVVTIKADTSEFERQIAETQTRYLGLTRQAWRERRRGVAESTAV